MSSITPIVVPGPERRWRWARRALLGGGVALALAAPVAWAAQSQGPRSFAGFGAGDLQSAQEWAAVFVRQMLRRIDATPEQHAKVQAIVERALGDLYPLRERVLKGLEYPGAALFSVFSGATGHSDGLPPYLVAAAAMESRAFPAFSYDPSAGEERPARFSLEGNPQPGADWPLHGFSYEDAEHQRVRRELAFTLADFAACDRRYAGYFARIPSAHANGEVPSLLMVDRDDCLRKVIVAEPLMREARRCLDAWHGMQALVKREAPPPPPPAKVEEAAKPAPAAAPTPEPEKAPASDDPYIETPRCTTCDECTKLNNRMFAYDANKQAYIADLNAGTYRELVEAAETCQVSIIHPGKPRNPDEPGLDELLERAAPFL